MSKRLTNSQMTAKLIKRDKRKFERVCGLSKEAIKRMKSEKIDRRKPPIKNVEDDYIGSHWDDVETLDHNTEQQTEKNIMKANIRKRRPEDPVRLASAIPRRQPLAADSSISSALTSLDTSPRICTAAANR